MMGEFYKEEDKKEKKDDDNLIDNFNELVATFDEQAKRHQDTMDLVIGKNVLPERHDLIGGESVQEVGKIGELRNMLKGYPRLRNMTIFIKTIEIMDSIERLDMWEDDAMRRLEQSVDSFYLLCKSAINLIVQQGKNLIAKTQEIEQLKKEMIPKPEPEPKMDYEETKEFKEAILERIKDYDIRKLDKDPLQGNLAKGRIFALCGKSKQKREIAQTMFDRYLAGKLDIGKNRQETKKNMGDDQEKDSNSPDNSSEKPLLDKSDSNTSDNGDVSDGEDASDTDEKENSDEDEGDDKDASSN
jgi:hypothetical protein